ncbi:MAG TPA: nuclear transport factor 2 family protein [Pyrinomonadaceae bacterium]|nr:nuclear transport factor 2 family protein [Pyrinomonadaceae bacterium]
MKKSLFLLAACFLLSVSASAQTQPKMSKDEQQLRALLNGTAEGWNKGDLPQYLSVYTPDATEMRSTGPAGGVEKIEETMKNGFWKTGRPIQVLRYENVVVRMLGKEGALVTGQYILSGADRPDRTGWFTSVWKKTKDGWKMIHDHS